MKVLCPQEGIRSGCENFSLVVTSLSVVPCCHGNPGGMIIRPLAAAPTRRAGLDSGACIAASGFGGTGAHMTGTNPRVTGAAAPVLPHCRPSAVERPAAKPTTTAPPGAAPAWRSTGPAGSYAPAAPGGSSRCGRGSAARPVERLPGAPLGRRSRAVSASRDRDAAAPTGGDGVSMAAAGVPGVRRAPARALACRRAQRDVRSPRASTCSVRSGGLALVPAYHTAGDGREVRRAEACGDAQPVGAGHHRRGRGARRGRPALRARASCGASRRDELVPRRPAGLVMGGGDEPRAGVFGADGPRGPGGPCAMGGAMCRHSGAGAFQCVPRGPSAMASAGLGAGAAGW